MNVGSVKSVVGGVLLAVIAAAIPLGAAAPGAAQTPDAACAADSLYLISPSSVDLRLETAGKPGLTVSWPNLNLDQATCFTLDGTDDLGFEVIVEGGFGDRVDRVFRFATPDSGEIGGAIPNNITFEWLNQGSAINGNIGGVFNLANNGGVWIYSQGASWSQSNNGLPMYWQRTNTVALDVGNGGFMLAAFTRGTTLDNSSAGLYAHNGTNWVRLGEDIFGSDVVVSEIAISPGDNNSFAVGTLSNGLYVTADGGQTFTQWRSELDPDAPTLPSNYRVTALNWDSERLLVFMPTMGLFLSEDGGQSFARSVIEVPNNLDLQPENQTKILPVINDFSVDPGNPDRIIVALNFHGAYESTDAGGTWNDLYGDLVVPDPDNDGAWNHSGLEVIIDAANPQVICMGVSQKGLYRTADGGQTWVTVADGLQPANLAQLTAYSIIGRPGLPGEILVMEDGWGLLHSTDSGASWNFFADAPLLNTSVVMVPRPGSSGDFLVGTHSGGIYVAGSEIELKDTYSTATSSQLRDLDLGLRIRFEAGGVADNNDEFQLVAQTFQGWAVWRAPGNARDDMTLIGLYDRVNPEDCFEGYCGDNSLEIIPQCFAAKRAACFANADVAAADTIRFFDEEVYNGFTYYYAVSAFDYGNTALTTPQNNTNEMLFSPRWDGDPLSPYAGSGNASLVNINEPAAADVYDDEIYAYPNPVRLGAGVPRDEGNLVVFTNLPGGSRVRVFTTAGDDVIDLGPETQVGGQIYWQTENREGESIAAGVYLYKVEMPTREDYWGRIVVIR